MEGACLTRATNYFVCTADGEYPGITSKYALKPIFIFTSFQFIDPTDCTKYHVCNGTAHYIETCPANFQFTYNRMDPQTLQDPYTYPGNGDFKCRFSNGHMMMCGMCQPFYCDGMPNQFTFRMEDYFHYAYCIEIGTLRKLIMFKCPPGTRHEGFTNSTTNSVDCIPVAVAP